MKHAIEVAAYVDRLDRAIAAAIPDVSRRRARTLIADGAVFVDGKRCRVASRTLHAGARIVVHTQAVPDPAKISVVYEDEDVLVIDKPAGVHVNETETTPRRSLEGILADYGVYVVHRLDVDTTGVLVFAKTKSVAVALSSAFAERAVEKTYFAVTMGRPEGPLIDAPIGPDRRRRAFRVHEKGKSAQTAIAVENEVDGLCAVVARPTTGRTHQIRVHLAHAGTPIVGDVLYGGPAAVRLAGEEIDAIRPWLHAAALSIEISGVRHVFEAPVPGDLARVTAAGLSFRQAAGLASDA